MIDIHEVEDVIAATLRENRFIPKDLPSFIAQELGPKIADFFHQRGVDIDWPDRSRYGAVRQ